MKTHPPPPRGPVRTRSAPAAGACVGPPDRVSGRHAAPCRREPAAVAGRDRSTLPTTRSPDRTRSRARATSTSATARRSRSPSAASRRATVTTSTLTGHGDRRRDHLLRVGDVRDHAEDDDASSDQDPVPRAGRAPAASRSTARSTSARSSTAISANPGEVMVGFSSALSCDGARLGRQARGAHAIRGSRRSGTLAGRDDAEPDAAVHGGRHVDRHPHGQRRRLHRHRRP